MAKYAPCRAKLNFLLIMHFVDLKKSSGLLTLQVKYSVIWYHNDFKI